MTIVGAFLGLVPGLTLGLSLVGALAQVVWAGAVNPMTLPITVPILQLTILGFLFVHLLLTGFLYLLAVLGTGATAPGVPTPTNALEELARGAMIGVNAGINLTVLGSLPLLNLLATPVAIVNFLACIPALSNSRFYQVVLAYFTLAMPAALPINLLGLTCWIINVVAWALGLAPFDWFIDWTHANYVTHGGITHGPLITAWNQANFSIGHPLMSRTDPWIDAPGAVPPPFPRAGTLNGDMLHEGAHTLCVAAFGWAFHLVGFIDVLIRLGVGASGLDAYAEQCAEGGLRRQGAPWVPIWTPRLQPPSPANDPPIGNCGITGPGVVDMGAPAFVTIREVAAVRATPLVAVTNSPPGAFVSDVNGTYPEPLGFLWQLAPPGAALAVAQVGGASFALPAIPAGDTTLVLTATDGAEGFLRSHIVHVLAAVIAGQTLAGVVGAPTTLDGSASTAGTSDNGTTPFPLTFQWQVVAQPLGPPPQLANADQAIATLTPGASGAHTVSLTVTATFPTAGAGPTTQTLTDVATAGVTVP